MPVCSGCGQANPEIARFCLACGAPVAGTTEVGREVRKRVTIVFADVTGWTALAQRLDPESLRRVQHRYFEEIRAAVERHGGTVEKFIGDAVMAVFGIPVLHEDDALRGVLAAAEMRSALASLNDQFERELGVTINARIGVNTGEVVAGDPASGQAFATGDAVNVAARLEQAAQPGEILVGELTYRLVRDAVTAEAIQPLVVKGKATAVSAFRLLAAAAGTSGTSRRLHAALVGRDDELGVLAETFSRVVRDRACQLVTVLGSPGVGKSRLVDEFVADRPDDAIIVRGRCLPYGEGITFFPIKEAIAAAAGLTADESPEAARDKIKSLLESATDADLVVDRVSELLGLAAPVPEHGGHGWAIGRLFESLAARRPLVAVFDDIQWAETTFLDLVEYLAAQCRDSPILLLCIARPELLDIRTSWARATPNASTIRVEPLSDDGCDHLIDSLLGETGLVADARARISEAAEGNPLFVEEVVTMLVDEGLLRRRSGRWVAAGDLTRIVVPPTIQAVLAARVERLGVNERAVLERGSVEGKVFHRGAVLHLSPEAERIAVADSLAALVEKDLVRPGPSSFADEDAFCFRHQLLRDAVYESLPKEARSHLHHRFATWLEEKVGERATEYEEILGYHLERAYRYRVELGLAAASDVRLAEDATKHLGRAGLRARARGDLPAAAKLLFRAVDLAPPESAAREELSSKLRDLLFESGELRAARISWASFRCFWHWRFGHRWVTTKRLGKLVLRCGDCGKAKRLPRWSLPEGGHPEKPFGPWFGN